MKYSKVLRNRYEGIKDEHEAIKRGEDPQAFIPTGLREFDKRAGHKRKMVTLYGAATGEGKSLWKLHIAREAARRGYKVFVLDMEDPEERTADRDFSHLTGINSALMLSGDLDDRQIMRIGLALTEAEDWADNIDVEVGVRTPEEALALIDKHNDADVALVDYLSAFPHGKKGREQAISDFMWAYTKRAQEHDFAGIAFAQVVKEVSQRGQRMFESSRRFDPEGEPYIEGFRPYDASELAWCTDAGKNAKELGFIFRPGRYLKRCGVQSKDNIMEFSFPKRNFGSEGTIRVSVDLATATFKDLPEKDSK